MTRESNAALANTLWTPFNFPCDVKVIDMFNPGNATAYVIAVNANSTGAALVTVANSATWGSDSLLFPVNANTARTVTFQGEGANYYGFGLSLAAANNANGVGAPVSDLIVNVVAK